MRVAVIHHALGRFGGAERMSVLHTVHLNLIGIKADLYYDGPILNEWLKMVKNTTSLYKLPFGLKISIRNLFDILNVKKKLDSYDIVLFHHHIDPFLAYYLTKSLKTNILWYCGEPLRALWEDKISGISYKELKETVKKTSEESFGRFVTKIFLTDYLYDHVIRLLRKIDIDTVKSFNTIIANSKYTKNITKKIYGIDNVTVVYPGIDTRNFDSSLTTLLDKLPFSERYILAIGAFIPMKNYETLVESYSLLPTDLRRECKLVIVGDGPLKRKVIAKAEKLGIKDDLIILSSVSEEELFSLYSHCEFIIHVALHEPFGLIPVEAGYFSKPSIVSNVGGTCETVINGKTGYVVNPKSPQEIRDSMAVLIENDNLRIKMGKNAKKVIIKEFTIEKSSENLVKILEEVC